MPIMDGLEFVRTVSAQEKTKGVPVVMITTEGSESHVVQALTAGARDTSVNHLRPSRFGSTCCPCGEKVMSIETSLAARSQEENWLPILELRWRKCSRSCWVPV